MKLGKKEVNAEYSIARAVSQLKIGDKVKLLVDRENKQSEVEVILEEAPEGFR
jgi:S1-C subfamily serine protease